jgi:hypothetical protein
MDLGLILFLFKYHTIFIFIVYGFVYLIESLFRIEIFSNSWIVKLFGTLCGYFINDLFIKNYTHGYYFYFQNIFKYLSILIFQNIISKIIIPNYVILNLFNIFRINFIIFIYFLLDIIMDVHIKDKDKNKEMYIDIVKATIGFYIVEKILKKELEYKDYIYMIVIVIGYYLFYTKMDNRVKELLKN